MAGGVARFKEDTPPNETRREDPGAVQAVALYGAELWWRGQKDRQRELQLLINQQARGLTGAFNR
jgi:hypothetical protein